MIKGVGIDLVDIRRIEKILERFPEKFLKKIFTPYECQIGNQKLIKAPFYAKRFAAKEALFKACGGRLKKSFREIEICNDKEGKPFLRFYDDETPLYCGLSLSDEYPYAQAIVILYQEI